MLQQKKESKSSAYFSIGIGVLGIIVALATRPTEWDTYTTIKIVVSIIVLGYGIQALIRK